MHLLADLPNYSAENLQQKRRTDLRKCRKLVTIVQLTDTRVLREQGYEVAASALKRIGNTSPPERQHYLDTLVTQCHQRLVLGGFVAGKLGGYLIGSAVNDVAYFDTVFIATEYLPTAIGTGLVFDFVQACRQSGSIQQVVYGLHNSEDPNLCKYKEGMGFPMVKIPTCVRIIPPLRWYIRWRSPAKYYRLTGQAVAAVEAQ